MFNIAIILSGKGQIKNLNLVNSKTKQWIQFSACTRNYNDFQLITKKNDSCEILKIRVSFEHERVFLDSLKKNGFKDKIHYLDKNTKYTANLELATISFDKVGDTDSIFKFTYKITLKDLKTNNLKTKYASNITSKKQKVLNTFATKTDYKFTNIYEIKETGIIMVDLYSETLFGPSNIFAPSRTFYF
jgi:hypothetical protein